VTPSLEKYYNDRFAMMTTQGWSDFVEDTQNMFNSYNKVVNVTNERDLYIKQGQLDILNWILTLKQTSQQAFEELSLEEDI
jgi:hypothetical protein